MVPPIQRLRSLLLTHENDGELARLLRRKLGATSLEVLQSPKQMLDRLDARHAYDIAFITLADEDAGHAGLAAVRKLRQIDSRVPIVAVAAVGDVDLVAQSVAAGASDFLVAAGRLEERLDTLLGKLRNVFDLLAHNRLLDERNRLLLLAQRERYRILGNSPEMVDVLDRIERVAKIPRPVLIHGERGTGKELVARAIHEASGRGERAFVAVNCAAFADTLLESELFGHERGAFTGAERTSIGKFEQAAQGTLFLDEIGNMALAFQQKILRVVEYGVFCRVGGTAEVRVNARLVAATNLDLEAQMRSGKFLRDLYDRLAFEVIEVPPLRQRRGDISLLAQYFFEQFMTEIPALGGKRMSRDAFAALERYPFPGNVRELKNIVERAVYRDVTNEITPEDMGLHLESSDNRPVLGSFHARVAAFEAELINQALTEANGNQAEASRRLGLTYDKFRYYRRKYRVSGSA